MEFLRIALGVIINILFFRKTIRKSTRRKVLKTSNLKPCATSFHTNSPPTWEDVQKRAKTDVGKNNSLSTNNIIIHSLILATMVLSLIFH